MGCVDVSGLAGGLSLKPTKVVIASNVALNLVNFRTGLIRALLDSGYEVITVASPDECVARLLEMDCRYIPLAIDGGGTHAGRDLLLLWRFWRLLRRGRADVYLGYTVKPNIYGSLAARALSIPVINTITGLGVVFIRAELADAAAAWPIPAGSGALGEGVFSERGRPALVHRRRTGTA